MNQSATGFTCVYVFVVLSVPLLITVSMFRQHSGRYHHAPNSGLESGTPSIPNFYKEDELKYHGKSNRGAVRINFLKGKTTNRPECSVRFPEDCVDNCEYSASWRLSGDEAHFSISSSNADKWTGIGFSQDRRMVIMAQI